MRTTRLFLASTVAAGLLGAVHLIACGGDASSGASSGASQADGGPSSSSPSASGSSTSPSTSACSGIGSLLFTTLKNETDGGTTAAVFADCFDAGTIPPIATAGSCAVIAHDDLDPLQMHPYIDPGTVHVTSPSSGIDLLLSATAPNVHTAQALVAPGTATFAVEGTTTIEKVQLAVDVPAHGALGAISATAARSADLSLSWTGASAGADGKVVVRISAEGAAAGTPFIQCSSPASDGNVVIATSLLMHLDAGKVRVSAEAQSSSSSRGAHMATVRQELDGTAELTLQ